MMFCYSFHDHAIIFIPGELIKHQSCHHTETSQMICSTNPLTGFYMMATLAFNKLSRFISIMALSNNSQVFRIHKYLEF